MRLILFDIDGTLIKSGGVGRRSLTQAVALVLGLEDAFAHVQFDGCTDQQIVTSLVQETTSLSDAMIEEKVAQIFDEYTACLPRQLETCPDYQVLDGVSQTLKWLQTHADSLLGLGTGNIKRGARLKLEHGDLWKYFSFGGYGDDSADRDVVLRRAWERAEAVHGSIAPSDILVVGDTPRDIRSAKANGMAVAAVATGPLSTEELKAHQPDLLWSSMSEGLLWFKGALAKNV